MSPWNLSVASQTGSEACLNVPPKKAISQSGTKEPRFFTLPSETYVSRSELANQVRKPEYDLQTTKFQPSVSMLGLVEQTFATPLK